MKNRQLEVLDWNQIFIDTLIATNTPNSSSQRLGAIVHTAIFDAYNGIERRYTPIFVHDQRPSRRFAPRGGDRRGAHGARRLVPSRQRGTRRQLRGVARGAERRRRQTAGNRARARHRVGNRGGAGRARTGARPMGSTAIYAAVQRRHRCWPVAADTALVPPPPPAGMSAQSLAFTSTFVLDSNTHFSRATARADEQHLRGRFNAVKALGRGTGSTRTADQTALAPFWEGNASVHWNQAANQIARANHLSMSRQQPASRAPEHRDGRHRVSRSGAPSDSTAAVSSEVTWRPATVDPLADTDGNPDTSRIRAWPPLVNTPCHPEYPAGHPSQNGAAATVLLSHFDDHQMFTLTTRAAEPHVHQHRASALGRQQRAGLGRHALSRARSQISDAVGEAIADYVNHNSMQRRHGRR